MRSFRSVALGCVFGLLAAGLLKPDPVERHAGGVPGVGAPAAHFQVAEDGSFHLSRKGIRLGGRFETASVSRGPRSLTGPAQVALREDLARVTRGDVVEELRDTEAGVEQTWSFATRPAGNGDLTVRVRADQLTFRSADDRGLSFDEPRTGSRVHYGAGTWIDARGLRIPVAARFDGEVIALSVPQSVVESSAYPAVLDPTIISSELAVGVPVPGAAAGRQWEPAAAYDGTNYLVAWRDERYGLMIYGTRVSPAGSVVDQVGFPISAPDTAGVFPASAPAIAFDGVASLVVWLARNSSTGQRSVVGRRVSKAGVALDAVETTIAQCGPESCEAAPYVAFDGTNHLVVWRSGGGRAARVSPAGTLLDATPIALPSGSGSMVGLSCDGVTCLVGWSTAYAGPPAGTRLEGARVAKTGALVDATPITLADPVFAAAPLGPTLVFDGTNHVAAYTHQATSTLELARLHPDGTLLSPLITPLTKRATELGFDGAAYHVLVHGAEGAAHEHLLVSTGGAVLAGPQSTGGSLDAAGRNAFACGPAGCLYAWSDRRDVVGSAGPSLTDIYAARFSDGGLLLDAPGGVRLSSSADDAYRTPVVASNGDQGLIVWRDDRGPRSGPYATGDRRGALRASRVTSNGSVLDKGGIELSGAAGSGAPAVASDGANYLITWTEGTTVMGRRLGASGALLDPAPFVISDAPGGVSAHVAFDGTNYAVFWSGRLTRVSPAGQVLDVPSLPVERMGDQIAFNGLTYLTVYRGGSGMDVSQVYGIRLDKSGATLGSAFLISRASQGEDLAVASDGKDFFVVWGGRGFASTIHGARIDADGRFLDNTDVVIAQEPLGTGVKLRTPAIAYVPAAHRYLVSYWRSVSPPPSPSENLWGVELDPDPWAKVGYRYRIWTGDVRGGAEAPRMLAAMDDGKVLAAYRRFDPEPPYGSTRVRARVIDLGATDADAGADAGAPRHDAGADGGGLIGAEPAPGATAEDEASGCGCRVAGRDRHEPSRGALALAACGTLALLGARRRKRAHDVTLSR